MPKDKKGGFWIVMLMVLNAMLDFFSLAFFLPLIFLLINQDPNASNKYIGRLYLSLNFHSSTSFIIFLAGIVLGFVIFKNVIALWITRTKAVFCFGLGSAFSSRLLEQYSEIGYAEFTRLDFSKEINRIANVPIAFANNIIMPLANLLSEGLVLVFLLVGIGFYDIKVLTLLATVLIPIALVYAINRRNLSKIGSDLKHKYPIMLKLVIQFVEGLVDIKSFGRESYFKSQFDRASRDFAATLSRDHTYQTSASRLTEIIAALMICTLIIYSLLSKQNTQNTFLLLGIYAAASFRVIPSLNRILNSLTQIRSYEYLLKEVEVLKKRPTIRTREHESALKFTNTIEMRDVSFQYPDRDKNLRSMSLIMHKGDKIALVGRSGAGKTSVIMLLLRFLNGFEGKLFLDGLEVNAQSLREWRKLFAYVPQSPYILDGTIVENIAFGLPPDEVNHARIRQLIRDLEMEEMIDQLPDGLLTQVGEKGARLSGGQRQRVAIARALYADAEILLLDEVTNQLDVNSEKEIVRTLEKITLQRKTILMITHHEHLLSHFDKVFTVENGTIRT
jgi:ABC-type multidrug transport system fused ATPase/permease subunit